MHKLPVLFENIKNRIKLGKDNYREVQELLTDIKQTLGYKEVKLNIKNKDSVVITGKNDVDHIELNANLASRKMVQKHFAKSKALLPSFMLPNRETTTIAKGTLDGRISRVKTVDSMSNKDGDFVKITKIENRVSGNTYRRTTTPNGNIYEKLVNGNYVNLFRV